MSILLQHSFCFSILFIYFPIVIDACTFLLCFFTHTPRYKLQFWYQVQRLRIFFFRLNFISILRVDAASAWSAAIVGFDCCCRMVLNRTISWVIWMLQDAILPAGVDPYVLVIFHLGKNQSFLHFCRQSMVWRIPLLIIRMEVISGRWQLEILRVLGSSNRYL